VRSGFACYRRGVKFGSAVVAFVVAACGGGDSEAPPKPGQPTVVVIPGDGGVGSTVTVPPGVDPSAVHLDDYTGTHRPVAQQPLAGRERRAIDVTLRSSPPGAVAAVDGVSLGPTPAFWSGFADGREHQFVFTLPGHAIARYRFVPVSSGVIHARLDPIAEERDAGVAPPPEVVPQPPPSAVVPPAPPPTIVPAPTPTPTPGSAGTSSPDSAGSSAPGSAGTSSPGSAGTSSQGPAAPMSGPQP